MAVAMGLCQQSGVTKNWEYGWQGHKRCLPSPME